MDDLKPKVSVLLPIYQGERYLRAAIDSILGQTFTNFEFIIIDDASTDGSANIATSYRDPRIRFLQHERNLGLIATLNKGLDLARATYVARMDQDDVSAPERLAKQVAFMDSRPDIAASGTWARDIDDKGRILGNRCMVVGRRMMYDYWWPCPIIHPSAIIRRSLLKDLRYDAAALHCEDYDLWLRLRQKHGLDNLPEYLMLYRVHHDSTSVKHWEIQLKSVHKSLCRNTGLSISYEEFLELIGLTRKLSPLGRARLRWRVARAVQKPLHEFLKGELLIAGDALRVTLKLEALEQRVLRSLSNIWRRIKPRPAN